jgi:membrane protein
LLISDNTMKISKNSRIVDRSKLNSWADRRLSDPSPLESSMHMLVRLVLIAAHEFKRNALSLRAGALTYTVLLALVPILAISTAVVKGLGGGDQLRRAAYTYIESLEVDTSPIPSTSPNEISGTKVTSSDDGENLTDHLRSAVDKLFDYVDKTNFATLGSFGVVGILLSAILVLGYIEEAMNAIWKVTAGRSLLRKITDYLTLLIIMPISINVAFAASAFLKNPVLASKVDNVLPFSWLQALLLKAAPVLIITLTFYIVYIFFPNTKVKTIPALVGSLLAAVFWFGVQNIYITLQVGVAKYNAIYGSFATLPLFLVWIYLGWMFILSGAQVAFACQHIKTYRLMPQSAVPSVKLSAAFDIMDAVYLAFSGKQPLTEEDLAGNLPPYSPLILSEVLTSLRSGGLLHISQSDERLLPALPPEHYRGKEVVEIILGTEVPDTDGGTRSFSVVEAAAQASRNLHGSIDNGRQYNQVEDFGVETGSDMKDAQ